MRSDRTRRSCPRYLGVRFRYPSAGLGNLARESNRLLLQSFEYYLDAAAAHHPLQSMVAVLARERSGIEDLRQEIHRACELLRCLDRFAPARPLFDTHEPRGQL